MTRVPDEALIKVLAEDLRPVRPLASPMKRAGSMVAGFAVVGTLLVLAAANLREFRSLHAGREMMLVLEMAAMLATATSAIVGAFFASVPGRSGRWHVAALFFLLCWVLLSGAGCFGLALPGEAAGGMQSEEVAGESLHCLLFILAASVLLAPPLIWRLSRATPINPLPVALLGGLGVAALSAFLLQFFHPFTVTFLDLGVHAIGILLVIAAMALLSRRALSPS